MLKFFCDNCGNECKENSAAAHRFAELIGPLGLEMVLVHGQEILPGHHICDECLPELLLRAASTFQSAKAVVRLNDANANAKKYLDLKSQLENELASVAKQEQAASLKQEEAEKLMAEADLQRQADADKISSVTAQLEALTTQFNTALRIKSGQKKQLEADIRDNSEYIQNIERRERIRMGDK